MEENDRTIAEIKGTHLKRLQAINPLKFEGELPPVQREQLWNPALSQEIVQNSHEDAVAVKKKINQLLDRGLTYTG